jgi:hypothetical protein
MAAAIVLAMSAPAGAQGQPVAGPSALLASDHPWDNGTRVDLTWTLSSDDAGLLGYAVRKKGDADPVFVPVDIVPPGTNRLTVGELSPGGSYLFQIVAIRPDSAESSPATTDVPFTPAVQWFDGTRFWFLLTLIVTAGAVMWFIALARRGATLKVRRIAGLEAVDDAVGRATEMGRPVLFIPGIQDMNEIQTIAGISILARVARTAAEYDATIEVPTSKSLVMTAARETVQQAYLSAGRPDAYNPDAIYYVTDEQFGYVAAVQGMMVRDRPAACFYMGSFFAESLLLAETGNGIGAIQIAGTAQPAQLPFFVAACDYTLIGEEFFAASAYLSGEADQLGSLKGQDAGKVLVAAGIVAGVIGSTLAALTGSAWIRSIVDYFTYTILA